MAALSAASGRLGRSRNWGDTRCKEPLLSLVCASHSGEDFHLDGVERILAGAGLGLDALQNTPSYPLNEGERDRWIREGREANSHAQNCSGKHSGMLSTCVVNGWDIATYLDPSHPLQQAILETVADLSSETPGPVAWPAWAMHPSPVWVAV